VKTVVERRFSIGHEFPSNANQFAKSSIANQFNNRHSEIVNNHQSSNLKSTLNSVS